MISSQPNNHKNRLFDNGKRRSLGFVVVACLSIVLMLADYHYKYLNSVRSGFSVFVSPLQYAVDYPVRVIGWVQSLVGSKTSLINENIKLRYQQTVLEAELQRLKAIKEENSQLKELLLTASKAKMRSMAAQILAVDTGSSRQLLVINKGRRDQVYIGQPVLDAKGVMGQIIDVGYMTSTVLLISDSKSAVPVRNTRTGERAILMGQNNVGSLSLINLPKTSSIEKNDLLVTSGLGRLYPEGYPVGHVEMIQSVAGEAFIKVDVSPIALLNRSRLVLLIWPDTEQAKLNEQVEERLNAVVGAP